MSPKNSSIYLSIADIQIDLKSPLSSAELRIDGLLEPFFGKPRNPAGRILLEWEESAEILQGEGELVYDPGVIWRMFKNGETWCAEISYADRTAACRKEEVRCLLFANNSWDRVTLTERRFGNGWHSLLALGAGELMVRSAMVLSDGIVLHAAGIDDNGHGIVFSGHSGAGKSTQLGFWIHEPGVIPMTDDRVAIRTLGKGGAVCYGTPWGGMPHIASNHSVPLKALILLEQDVENRMTLLSPEKAAAMLACRAFLPYWDRSLMQRAFLNLDRLVKNTPVYLLRCRAEPSVVDFVRSVL